MEIKSDISSERDGYLNSLACSVADHVSAMLAYWDKDQICRFANNAYLEWFGKTKEVMMNRISMKELLGPLYEKNLPHILAVLRGEPQTFEREIPLPSGGSRHSIANYFPDIENGEVKGFFVHVADVTPLKKLEFELKEKEKNLIRSIQIINDQNKLLINFAHLVSHNLRTHAGNLETVLNLFIAADSAEEKNEMLTQLIHISEAFNETVSNLNEIVRVTTNQSAEKEMINLRNYIEKIINLLASNIKAAGATVINNVSDAVQLFFNPAYMESILLNIISNAIRYRAVQRPSVIELNAYEKDSFLVLNIKDNGIGINLKKYGKKLFGLYQTFHGNADAKGVGLFITKYQIESMDGFITVQSEEGAGTTFSLHFKLDNNVHSESYD